MLFPFEPLRFTRYARPATREWTARRLAAAAKAIRREREAVPLFPELARYAADDKQALAQRRAEMDQYSLDLIQSLRDFRARAWREARVALRAMPPITRAGIVRYWNQARMPADPGYLLGVLHEERVRHRGGWERLRQLRQFQLAGAGRLPRSIFADALKFKFSVRSQTWGPEQWRRRHQTRKRTS